MRGLEHEGWMKQLASGWSSAKANAVELEKLREGQMQLQLRGINADASAAHFPLLTAKMQAKDVKVLKKSFPRQGFVKEVDALEGEAKKFAAELGARQAATPSVAWKMLMRARPEVVLWVAYSTKNAALQAKFKNFYTEWPQARQKIPYTLMQEMRIVPGLAGFDELVEKVFFELMDGKLGTEEAMKAYLGPYSPPAPPPPVHLRRARATKKDGKVAKARKKADAGVGQPENGGGLEEVAAAAHAAEGLPAAVAAKPRAEKGKAADAKPVEPKAGAPAKVAAKIPAKPVAVKKVAGKKAPVAKAAKKAAAAAKTKVAAKPAKKLAAKKSPAKAAAKKVPAKTHAKVVAKPKAKAGAKAPVKKAAKAAKKPAGKGAAKKKK
jgi:hypothetical protein